MTHHSLRVGIIGTGFMGRVHAQAAQSAGARIVAVAGSSKDSAARFAGAIPGAVAADGIESLLDAGIDLLHVCTPNSLHYDHAMAAIRAGVNVICEKPLATGLTKATALTEEAETAGIVTAVPFVYRYYPVIRAIKDRIRNDTDNPLWLLHGSYLQDWLAGRDDSNWRVDPNAAGSSRAFGDIGVHWCDLVEYTTGQRIVSLSARFTNAFVRAGGQSQNLTEDGATVLFETDTGAQGSVVVSQASAGRKNRLWFSLDGPQTSYSFNQESPETAWLGTAEGGMSLARDPGLAGARPGALPAGHPQGYQQCFNDFVDDAYAAVNGQSRPGMPTFLDGLRAANITAAVVESARQRTWVDVASVNSSASANV